MYRGNNPAAIRSKNEILQGFFSLLEKKPLDEISVKQLMLETQLTRQTFYQIFASKEEILEYYLETVFEKFISHASTCEIHNLCDAAKVFFHFFGEYRDKLMLIIRNGKSCVIQRKCREFLQNSNFIRYELKCVDGELEQQLATTFIVSGIVAMLEQWIREEEMRKLEKDALARLVCRITGAETG